MTDTERAQKDRASRLVRSGAYEEALELYQAIVNADPSELQIALKMGDLHVRLGQPEAAIAVYTSIASTYEDDGMWLRSMAVSRKVLALDPKDSETLARLARLSARRRGEAASGPRYPVTLHEMGISPPPQGMARYSGVSASSLNTQDLVLQSEEAGRSPLVQSAPELPSAPEASDPETLSAEASHALFGTDNEGDHTVWLDLEGKDEELLLEPVETVKPSSDQEEAEARLGALHIPLFSDLPKNALLSLMEDISLIDVQAGETIVHQGDPGDSFFILVSGRAKVLATQENGGELCLAYLNEGAVFGEMALLQDGVRTATVLAAEDCELFEITQALLNRIIGKFPSVARVLRSFFRQRLLSTAMATHPMFNVFAPDDRRGLMEQFKSRSFPANSVLLEQDKPGSGLFVILFGQLEVKRKTEEGDHVVLAMLSAGEMFGEMSLLTNAPTVASVTAVSDCFVLRLSKRKFDEMIMTHPQVLELIASVRDERLWINDALLGAQRSLSGGVVLV